MGRRKPEVAALEDRIGYRFTDRELLARALTHVSFTKGRTSYQRLEFLGDRVLGLAVAENLFAAFPEAPEGELSRRLSDLVRAETCAEVALAWDVGPHLHLGAGELLAGGRQNRTILADVCEAMIGAVFLDGGYEAAKALVARAFDQRLRAAREPARDPKTALQEWAQGRGLPTPVYDVVERSGPDHAPVFRIAARVGPLECGLGEGPSKRAAEQDAALNLLRREGVWKEPRDDGPDRA
jgi:ribonuclease III